MRTIVVAALLSLPLTLARPAAAQQAQSPDERVAAQLEARTVTLNFVQVPLGEFGLAMCDLLDTNVVVAPGCADRPVTVRLRDVPAKAALTAAARAAGVELSITHGVVYLHPKGAGLGAIPALPADLRRQLITFNFDCTPATEALLFFQDITGANLVATAAVGDDVKVSLQLRNLPLDLALAIFARQAGLEVRVEDGVLVFDRPRSAQ